LSIVFGTPTAGYRTLVEARRNAERVLAADRDERVDVLESSADSVDAAVELVRVRARGADDSAAAGEDPGDLRRAERLEELLDHSAPPLPDADHRGRAPTSAARPRGSPRSGRDSRRRR
jgi:hypothetical protein